MRGKGKGKQRNRPGPGSSFRDDVFLRDKGWDIAAPLLYLLFSVILFAAFLFSSKMLFGTDTLPMGYAARKVYADLVHATGALPLWNPYIMGGIPMVDGLMGGDMFYPTTILQFLLPVHRALGIKLVIHVILAGWFFYLFAREKGIGRPASIVGGTGYMFTPYLISLIYAGHDGKLFVASLLPLGFLALERLLRRGRFSDMLLFGSSIGLMILTSHLQLAFFACGAFGFRFIWECVAKWRAGKKDRIARLVILFLAAALLGVAIGAVQTYPAYQYTSAFSPRAGGVTYEFATSWSIHWEEAVSMIVPDFGGYCSGVNPITDSYWGKNPFKLNCESPGFLIMLLVIAGLFRIRRDRELIFWYVLLLVTFIYALGAETPFFRLIYMIVPKFFRAPSTILFLFAFGSVVIGSRVLDSYIKGVDRSRILAGFALAGGLLLLLLLLVSIGEPFYRAWSSIFHRGIPPDRIATAVRYASATQGQILFLLLLGAVFVGILEGGRRSRWPVELAAFPLALLVFLSNAQTNHDFVKAVRLENHIREDSIIRKMKEDPSIFRALSTDRNYLGNYFSIFGIEAARGFFDNRIRWYDEIASQKNIGNLNILNLLNVKYLRSSPGMQHPAFEELVSEGGWTLYRNRAAYPRAFLADRYEVVSDGGTIISRIKDGDIDPRRVILLEEDPGFLPAGLEQENVLLPVNWVEYTPNRLRIRVSAERPSLLFVSNSYLPYWHARIDGEEAPLLRAHYAFQAVPVEAGEHEVTLYFRSPPYIAARNVTLAALAFLLAGAVLSRIAGRKWERKDA